VREVLPDMAIVVGFLLIALCTMRSELREVKPTINLMAAGISAWLICWMAALVGSIGWLVYASIFPAMRLFSSARDDSAPRATA
jgi:hypothetical protein